MEVSIIVPPLSEFLYGVLATIILILDKEPCVAPVVAKKLAACWIVFSEADNEKGDGMTPPNDDNLDDFVDPLDSPRSTSPALEYDDLVHPDPNPLSQDGASTGGNAGVAARFAARQKEAAASVKARQAIAAKKANASASKRKGSTLT